jgi:sorting nexin-3/12
MRFRKKEIIKYSSRVAGHPLAQNERSLHVFLQESIIDHDKYVPGKVRNS